MSKPLIVATVSLTASLRALLLDRDTQFAINRTDISLEIHGMVQVILTILSSLRLPVSFLGLLLTSSNRLVAAL
jgi:hypothetical protein